MWKRPIISDEKQYTLSLCQNAGGRRFCIATEAGISPPDMVFQTQPIEGTTLRSLSEDGALLLFERAAGQSFVFGAHGEWFTAAEEEALADDHDFVPWVTSVPPTFPPK